jgi:hypothetical protein
MHRRTFACTGAAGPVCVPLWAMAQLTNIPRVGFLRTDIPPQAHIDAFVEQPTKFKLVRRLRMCSALRFRGHFARRGRNTGARCEDAMTKGEST